MKKFTHEVIFCIVNAGYAEVVMDTARDAGAGGGTVLHARGTARSDAEKLFGIVVQPEKEIVMIIVKAEMKDSIFHALYGAVGLNSPGQGIAFSMPVDKVVGISDAPAKKPEAESEAPAENTDVEKK